MSRSAAWVRRRARWVAGRAFSCLGERLEAVDLLDRAPLAPFGRRALRNVLLWMLLAAFLSLSDLLSYEARIEGVAEWPIDASMLLRLGIYPAIGLGPWVGAAVVERFLETALG